MKFILKISFGGFIYINHSLNSGKNYVRFKFNRVVEQFMINKDENRPLRPTKPMKAYINARKCKKMTQSG
jgi:hypothetical protein